MWDPQDDHPTIEPGRVIEATNSLPPDREFREAQDQWPWLLLGVAGLLVTWLALYGFFGGGQSRSGPEPAAG
jgi:hypothetical protein